MTGETPDDGVRDDGADEGAGGPADGTSPGRTERVRPGTPRDGEPSQGGGSRHGEPGDDTDPGREHDEDPDRWDVAGVDAAFADIVARLRAEAPSSHPGEGDDPGQARDSSPRHGAGRDAPPPAGPAAAAGATPQEPRRDEPPPEPVGPDPGSPEPPVPVGGGWGERDEEDSGRSEREADPGGDGPDGGHFVPPEPAPLPRLDAITGLAWLGVVGGPLLLVVAAVLGGLPTWAVGSAVAGIIVGFVVLVSRLPRREDTDPDDDGAVV